MPLRRRKPQPGSKYRSSKPPGEGSGPPGACGSCFWRVCARCDIPEIILNIHQRCQAGSAPDLPSSPSRLNAVFTSGPGCPLTPTPTPPAPRTCTHDRKALKGVHFQTYYGHQGQDVVLEVAAVVLHHLAVGHQHDFNEAGVGQEAL